MNMNVVKETKFTNVLHVPMYMAGLIHGFILQILNVKIRLSSKYLQKACDSKGNPKP
jgi:hypothetical protein